MAKGTINKVIILGRLGADPEMQVMPSGASILRLRIATNESYKQNDQLVEHTEWHRVTFFGKAAEVISQYARKGSLLYIEGKLKTNKWQDKDGAERYSTDIVGSEFQFIQTGGGAKDSGNAKTSPELSAVENFSDDDLPF